MSWAKPLSEHRNDQIRAEELNWRNQSRAAHSADFTHCAAKIMQGQPANVAVQDHYGRRSLYDPVDDFMAAIKTQRCFVARKARAPGDSKEREAITKHYEFGQTTKALDGEGGAKDLTLLIEARKLLNDAEKEELASEARGPRECYVFSGGDHADVLVFAMYIGPAQWLLCSRLDLGAPPLTPEQVERARDAGLAVERFAQAEFESIDGRERALFSDLSELGFGVASFHPAGKQHFLNGIARQYLGEEASLERASALASGRAAKDKLKDNPVPMSRRVGDVEITATVQPFARMEWEHSLFYEPKQNFLILERKEILRGSRSDLAQRFGLSKAEARLVGLICEGLMLKDAALAIGIAEGTARQQLKSIFRKTDTFSQHQLVVKVLA